MFYKKSEQNWLKIQDHGKTYIQARSGEKIQTPCF